MIVSGVYGPQVWHQPLADIVGVSDTLGDLSVTDVWAAFILVAFFVGHLPSCIYHVAQARRAKNLPLAPVLLEWTPMVIFTASLVAWLGSPYSTLLEDNHLCLLSVTMSFVFGRMTTKIILAHLTRQPFPYWTAMLAPLIGGAVLANMPYLGLEPVSAAVEYYYLCGYFVFALIVYFRWAYLVINAICEYLGIQCLTIPEEKWRALRKEKSASTQRELNGVAKGAKGRHSQ
jgi:ethanolaminephosphotransferase